MSKIYANLFLLFVAPPGVGKSVAIDQGKQLATKVRKLKLSPDDMTKASLLDALSQSQQTHIYSAQDMVTYHSLQMFIDELGTLVSDYDLSFMSVANKLYDCPSMYKETRRGREGDLVLENPQANLIAGTQPDFLASILPPEAWGMGFMSRIVMIYSGTAIKTKLFGKKKSVDTRDLFEDLKVVCELHGEATFDDDSGEALEGWNEGGLEPRPEHTKLKHYTPRRILTILKLCIVSSVSRGNSLVIDIHDFERAKDWLLEVEAIMPDIFKDMSGTSDANLIQDLHFYVAQYYNMHDKKPVHVSRVMTFLSARTPAYNVENVLKLCVRAKILNECGVDYYTPGTTNALRVE